MEIPDDECARIEALERMLLDPAVRARRARVDALLADEFLEIGASGAVFGKAVVLDALSREHGIAFESGPMRVRAITKDVACITYGAMRTQGDDVRRSLRSSWWRRDVDGQWRMVFHQGTPDTGLGAL